MIPKKRLGELLIEAGVIDGAQLRAALGHQRRWGMRLGQSLVELRIASEEEIVRALSGQLGFEVVNLAAVEPRAQEQAGGLLPREFAVRNNVLPLAADAAAVTVAMSDPTNLAVLDEIRFRAGRRVKVCIGGDREIADAVARCYPGGDPVEPIALDLEADPAAAGEAAFEAFAPEARQGEPGAVLGAEGAQELVDLLEDGPEGEPILASELAPPDEDPASSGSRELTPRELAILDALDGLARGGPPVEPEVVKPAQAIAATIRLLLRKRIVTEEELLDELGRK